MITEDYVSFETAKLLKEKGFDEFTYACFTFDGDDLYGYRAVGDDIMRPTLQMAMKWLRDVHNIFIAINMIPDTIQKPYFFKPFVGKKIYNFPLDYSVEFYTTYEEACEAAIKYCLENLV
jgi:hypothetical protein